jgi:putative DNA methylase
MSSDTRLIERWLPIAALGEESVRERRSMTALPPIYYLHAWWARRPLVASRAAILGSLLPHDVDANKFLRVLGIHGDPVETRRRIDRAKRTGEDLGPDPYGYTRAFQYLPDEAERRWLKDAIGHSGIPVVLDPTAGGGSIPFEATRLGLSADANDLNAVAALLLKATVEYPVKFGMELVGEFRRLADQFKRTAFAKYRDIFPAEPDGIVISGFLWTRTITCPYCDGLIPLSPNWRLSSDGTGVRLIPNKANGVGHPGRHCTFEIVTKATDQSEGTVSGGDATCPYEDCRRVVDGDEVKRQAELGRMGEQLYAIVYKRRIWTKTKTGKKKEKWIREFRSPTLHDDNSDVIKLRIDEKLLEWEALDIIPTEPIPDGLKTAEPIRYGMRFWRDLFSPRQLLCHGTSVEVYREILEAERKKGNLSPTTSASFVYLALALDKLLNYNSRMSIWMPTREVIANTFNRHDFAFCWSHAEMAALGVGLGYEWVFKEVEKCVRELVELVRGEKTDKNGVSHPTLAISSPTPSNSSEVARITCTSADALDHLADSSIDVIVIDPPYYNNVMYAELADFFYVWLKRTAGNVVPDLFKTVLTDKEHEAVANPARFKGSKGATILANRDYREKMAAIFAECRRVMKPSGIMTLMFTHKATGAWDALTKGLMQAGFTITASWPINTEAEGSLHIKDKAAANSTIFLVCRPRGERADNGDTSYWEDVEPQVAGAVRERIKEFQDAGIGGVDLYLACFGPALQKFSEHWPLRRGTPRPQPETRKRQKQAQMFEEPWDPYEVTPEDALDAARREVKRWRLQQLTHMKARNDLDPLTSFYVLAWDAFRAPKFDYDEALRLARAVGVDLDKDIIGHVAEKKSSEIILWDSAKRASKGAIGPADGSRSWLDTVHHAAFAARSRNLQHAQELLNKAHVESDPAFCATLEAVLEVLPVSKAFSGIDLEGDVAEFGSDFEALENLRKLAFAADVDEPQQLKLWREEVEATGEFQQEVADSKQTASAEHSEER